LSRLNKKIKLYLLIAVNVLAWGYVVFKIYGALKTKDDFILETNNYKIKSVYTAKNSEVKLNLNYPDPFLKDLNLKKTDLHNSNSLQNNSIKKNYSTNTSNIKVPEPSQTIMPDIKYLGFISNVENGKQTVLVSINGKSIFVNRGQKIDDVLFKDITPTELTVTIGKKQFIIKK
jgi:hypothetical protein